MKNILRVFVLLFTAFTFSCDDSFLEENKKQIDGYNLEVPLFVEPVSQFTEVSVTLPDLKNKDFNVFQYPKIIHFETFAGHIDETGKLAFRIKVDSFDNPVKLEPQNLGNIILNVEDFGLLAIKVQSSNWGTPKASINETLINFGTSRSEKDFKIENWANGFLWYRLIEKPSWLNLRRSSIQENYLELNDFKMLEPSSFVSYAIFLNTEGLAPGKHEGEIVFETTDEANPILRVVVEIEVLSYENPETMIPIEGVVMDAEFDKNTNTLWMITQNPSMLISYNLDTQSKKQISLEAAPYCINLSEDKKVIMIGQSTRIELVESSSLSIKEKIAVNYIVYDIVDAGNGYYYLVNKEKEIFAFNTTTKTISKLTFWNSNTLLDGMDMILKVKDKPQLLLSRSTYSPNGLYLVDIVEPTNPKLINYWHSGFGKRFFTSTGQDKVYSEENGHVYRFPSEAETERIYDLGKLVPFGSDAYEYYFNYTWFDHNPEVSKIWAAYSSMPWLNKNIVSEFNDQTFDRLREIPLNPYVATINGIKDYYNTIAHYVFSSKNGERLILIKNIDQYETKNWHIEVLDVTN
ncbi:MAG: hypothetical protein Q4G48_05590 [Bacteroidia bacterium]|nr:hypothetical protein [Bacteroidia bacterium]